MDLKIWACVGLQYGLHKTKKLHSKTNMNEKEIWELEINMIKIWNSQRIKIKFFKKWIGLPKNAEWH